MRPRAASAFGFDEHAHQRLAVAEDADVGDALHRRQPVDDVVLHQLGQVLDRHVLRRDGEAHDGVGIVVGLDDGTIVDVVGKLPLDVADRVAQIVGGDVEIDGIVELHDDAARCRSGWRRRSP